MRGRNIIVSQKRLYAIDNDYSFADETKLGQFMTFFWTPLKKEDTWAIQQFEHDNRAQENLRTILKNLLPEEWVEACIKRIRRIARQLKSNGNVVSRICSQPRVKQPLQCG